MFGNIDSCQHFYLAYIGEIVGSWDEGMWEAVCKPALRYVISCYRAVDTQCYVHRWKGRACSLYQTHTYVLVSACGQLTGRGPTLRHTAGGADLGSVRLLPPAQRCQRTFTPELHNILNSVALKVPRLRPLVLLVTVALRYKLLWSIGGMILTGGNRSTGGKNLTQCHFVHHKYQTDWPGIEPGSPRREAGDCLVKAQAA